MNICTVPCHAATSLGVPVQGNVSSSTRLIGIYVSLVGSVFYATFHVSSSHSALWFFGRVFSVTYLLSEYFKARDKIHLLGLHLSIDGQGHATHLQIYASDNEPDGKGTPTTGYHNKPDVERIEHLSICTTVPALIKRSIFDIWQGP